MAKETKKLLLTTVILSMLLISVIPNVHAAEATNQEKGLSIISNVIGLDLTKYTVTPQVDSQASYLDVVPQENVMYDFTSEGSKLKMLYTFANGKLQMIHVLENEGAPSLTKPASSANPLELAQDFLGNYQIYTSDPLFGELKSTLNNVEAPKNLTKTSGNTALEVSAINGYSTFKWYYTVNGAVAPYSKFISLGFKDGFLTAFVDNWHLYNVGSTSINLSKEEAIDIALDTAKAHFEGVNLIADSLETENFNESNVRWTALIFGASLGADKARSEDALELYPVWRVGIALDKWYGYLYGIEVDVWADTKEVRYVQEAWSTLPPPEGSATANLNSIEPPTGQVPEETTANSLSGQGSAVAEVESHAFTWTALPTLAAAIIVTATVWVSRKKNSHSRNLVKPRSLKAGGILLCVLIASMILLVPIAFVNAELEEKGGAVVWGSQSIGAFDTAFPPQNNWRKSANEISLQQSVADNITWNDFDYTGTGYDGHNYQGGSSVKSNVTYYLSYLNSTYARLAVVDFDHGVGTDNYSQAEGEFHFMFEDYIGTIIGPYPTEPNAPDNGVYDMDIYPLVGKGQVIFAFINTCYSAYFDDTIVFEETTYNTTQGMVNGNARGMPFAFTHRIVKYIYGGGFDVENDISSYGYHYPDSGHQVYIGFPYGSAALDQEIPYDTGPKYHLWVTNFFHYALRYDMSVNDALDHASWTQYGEYFGDSPLWTGFNATWWTAGENVTQSGCRMAIYGNGNIHLRLYSLTVNSPVATADVYIDDAYRGTTGNSFAVDSGSHTLQVDSSTNTFHNFTGYSEFENPITVSVTSDTTIQANYYADPPPQYTLSISAGEGGTTLSPYTPGDHQLTPGPVTVTADPDEGYIFDSWLLDDEPDSENSMITVPMSSNHTLHAIFSAVANRSLTLDAEDGDPLYPNVYIDSEWVGTAPDSFLVEDGWHYIEVDDWVWNEYSNDDEWFCYFWDSENYYYYNPIYILVNSDVEITAYYWNYD